MTTNSPTFEKQLALSEYWKEIGGTVMLPGTNRAADRFARASFYVNAIPKTESPVEAIASTFSVIRNVSVPFGITTPDQPNISSTRWRTVSDQKRKLYFFELALTPNIFWVDLTKLDLSEKTGKVMKLDLGPNQTHIYSGMANDQFKDTQPFKFQATVTFPDGVSISGRNLSDDRRGHNRRSDQAARHVRASRDLGSNGRVISACSPTRRARRRGTRAARTSK